MPGTELSHVVIVLLLILCPVIIFIFTNMSKQIMTQLNIRWFGAIKPQTSESNFVICAEAFFFPNESVIIFFWHGALFRCHMFTCLCSSSANQDLSSDMKLKILFKSMQKMWSSQRWARANNCPSIKSDIYTCLIKILNAFLH